MLHKTITQTPYLMEKFSFEKGLKQLTIEQTNQVRDKIMSALDIKSRMSFWRRSTGSVEPKVTEVEKIEAIFGEYGITEIWGK